MRALSPLSDVFEQGQSLPKWSTANALIEVKAFPLADVRLVETNRFLQHKSFTALAVRVKNGNGITVIHANSCIRIEFSIFLL
jgi:hypothetical protein